MQVQVGSIIKSFDFPGNKGCFMVGRVTKIEGDFIYCDTQSVTFSDKPVVEFDPKFRTPMQGLYMFDHDADPRIMVLES